jgi:hypothetical protein
MIAIDHLIQNGEVLTSSQFIKRVTDEGYSNAHARKLIQKKSAKNGIWRSKHIALPKNIRLFSREGYCGTKEFTATIIPILQQNRPGLARVYGALTKRNVLLKPHVELLLASPHNSGNSKCPTYFREVAALEELKIAKRDGTDGVLERIVSTEIGGTPQSHALGISSRSSMIIQTAMTKILVNHFRRQNLISWNTISPVNGSDSLAVFNNFYFSASGFSWVRPLLKIKRGVKPKPTPVVFDVWPHSCSKFEVESFLERIKRAGQNKQTRLNFLGIIAAVDFELEAWNMAREAGLMAINLRQFFGEAALDALVQIELLLKNVAGDPSRANDSNYTNLAKTLEELKTNPYVVDLRSIGFEAISALLLRSKGWEDVQMGLKVPFQNSEREIDVNGHKDSHDQLYIVECKAEAANKSLDPEDVRRFFLETVRAFIKAKCNDRMPKHCAAEIWTTGQVGSDAIAALNEIKLKSFIQPRLRAREEVKKEIPHNLQSCKRLIEAISAC